MKQSRMALALFGALAALLLSSVASHAQTVVQNGQKAYSQMGALSSGITYLDSLGHVVYVDESGRLHVMDDDRDRDKVQLFQDCVGSTQNGISLVIGAADSTSSGSPMDVHAYRYLTLLIDPTISAGDTNTNVRLAFQFRECMNGNQDSTSLFPIYMYGQSPQGVSATAPDTSASGHIQRGNAGAPWSGEYVVTISNNRGQVANSISVNGRVFYYPNNIAIPLDSFFGRPVRFNKLSIRVRNLGYVATAQSATLTGHIHLLGFAQ